PARARGREVRQVGGRPHNPVGARVMTIGVLVTTCDSWPLAQRCIEAHLRLAGDAITDIVLVDDASRERREEAFLDPRVRLIRNEWSQGYVQSVNIGLRHLTTDVVVMFDADATPLMNYAPALLREFECDPALGIIGFTTVDR